MRILSAAVLLALFKPCLLLALLWTMPGRVAAGEAQRLWEIGRADNDTREFALAPDRYHQFGRDGFFIVGQSDPKQDWPYCHPGPADTWAGGRAHAFSIFFGLAHLPDGPCRLVVDLVNTHYVRPPLLRINVNGRVSGYSSINARPEAATPRSRAIPRPAGNTGSRSLCRQMRSEPA